MPNFGALNETVYGVIGVGLVVSVFALLIWLGRRGGKKGEGQEPYRHVRPADDEPEPADAWAVASETVKVTWVGSVSLVALVASTVGYAGVLFHAETLFQQMEAHLSLLCCILVFGLGIALGRRRTYTIVRRPHQGPQ
ncbi:MAG TPA: hypothetical protein VNZ94_01885 [Xanthobacteraceae bacterium]|nr:hypothetical protein [Xanthobacteraceae bacterium]